MGELTVVKPEIPDALTQLAEDFVAHSKAKGLSPRSWDAYRFALHRVFLPWCAEQGITDPSQLSTRFLEKFSTRLLEEGGARGPLSRASVVSYSRSVRAFLRWAEAEGELGHVRIPIPKQRRRVLDVLSREEVQALEDAATTERDKLVVRVLADTGIRLGELRNLRGSDILANGGRAALKVRGKTGERLVPLTPQLARRLQRYFRGRHAEPDERLFVTVRRQGSAGFVPLSESAVEAAIRSLATSAGITRRVYPHLLRHSFATNALRRGMSVVQLQQILGHESLRMISDVYSHLNTDDAHDALMRVLLGEER